MKQTLFLTALITAFLLASCSKEKKVEKMLYGEWEVTSFMHGANDLTQFYLDSCKCRLVFKDDFCLIRCPFNDWNFYYSEFIVKENGRYPFMPITGYSISKNGTEIQWALGNTQPDSNCRWGMYPLTIANKENSFYLNEISDKSMQLQFTDSTNIPYNISFSKYK